MTTVTFAGTIAPYIFEHSAWSQGLLVDAAGVFGTRGDVLTGDAFNVTWTYNNGAMVNGVLTINGYSLTYGPGVNNIMRRDDSQFYVGTTVIPGDLAMNTFINSTHMPHTGSFTYTVNPLTDNLTSPMHLGGGFRYFGLNGYFNVASLELVGGEVLQEVVVPPPPVMSIPGPIAGAGLPGLLIIGALLLRAFCQRRMP